MEKSLSFVVLFCVAMAIVTSVYAQNPAAGELLVKQRCSACHTFTIGGPNKVGPNLFGVMNRKAGQADGYKYSPGFSMITDKVVWSDKAVVDYLADPTAFVRTVVGDAKLRSKMTFKLPGLQNRKDVAAYLGTLR